MGWFGKALAKRGRRRACRIPGEVRIGGRVARGYVKNVSLGGFLFRTYELSGFVETKKLELKVPGVRCQAEIVARRKTGLHCRFVPSVQADAFVLYLLMPLHYRPLEGEEDSEKLPPGTKVKHKGR